MEDMSLQRAIDELVRYLSEHDVVISPELDEDAIDAFERELGATLPQAVRALYRRCGGIGDDALEHVPMRLLSPEEALGEAESLAEQAETYKPHPLPDARYFFVDDGGNWAGVYVEGPLKGKVVLLDHDEPSSAPRFFGLAAFLSELVVAGRDHGDFTMLTTSYPLSSESSVDLIDDARPLAHEYLERSRRATTLEGVLDSAEAALHLLPPDEWQVMQKLLSSEHQFIRWNVLRVAGRHKTKELVPDIAAYAKRSQDANDYTHWRTAYEALVAIGAIREVEALHRAKPKGWNTP